MRVFAIWEGGLGIWGAIALGGVGAWIACRRAGVPLTFFADAVAPGLPVAQAIGRLGNWFNNELYGSPTSLPWGLTIYDYDLARGQAVRDNGGNPIELPGGPFHPTFLYELLWNLGVAALVLLVDRRWKFGHGRAFALYVMAYCVGRFWIEALRIDEAHEFAGLRVNNWVSILVFLGALIYFLRVRGPQEHVRVDEDGRLHLVTAEGEPIPCEWGPNHRCHRRSGRRRSAGDDPAGDDPPGDAPPGPDDAASDSDGSPASDSADTRRTPRRTPRRPPSRNRRPCATAVVVGAGVGGLAAAGALARAGWHVTLLERADRLRGAGGARPAVAQRAGRPAGARAEPRRRGLPPGRQRASAARTAVGWSSRASGRPSRHRWSCMPMTCTMR